MPLMTGVMGAAGHGLLPPFPPPVTLAGGGWIHWPTEVAAGRPLRLLAGDYLEVARLTSALDYESSLLFKVIGSDAAVPGGQRFSVEFGGASEPAIAQWVLEVTSRHGLALVLHLCDGLHDPCPLDLPNAAAFTLHATWLRYRDATGVVEPWALDGHRLATFSGADPRGLAIPVQKGRLRLPDAGSAGLNASGRSGSSRGPAAELDAEAVMEEFEKFKKEFRAGKIEDPRTRLLFAATERADRLEKEKDAGRTRHRDRKRRRPSDSEDEDDRMLSLFGDGSARESTMTLRAQALKYQGRLYQDGLSEINKFLASRGEPGDEGLSGGRMVAYLTTVFHGHYSAKEVGPRDSRELRTLAARPWTP